MSKVFYKIKDKVLVSNNKLFKSLVYNLRDAAYFCRYLFSKPLDDYNYLKGKKKCIVCLAADYGNLGDVAITYAQTKFLKEKFPGYEIVDFPISKTISHLKSLKKNCSADDIITLTGGGYMGDMYFRSELLRQLVIKVFKNNPIISFPQTAYFSTSDLGQHVLASAQKVYSSCRKLELWARDEKSYVFMKEKFSCNVVRLTPDIAMWLDELKPASERTVITLCLRNDLEKNATTDSMVENIKRSLPDSCEVESYDTHIGNVRLDVDARYEELNKIWTQFRKSRLIITDRLHGMIFSYITGTPALVLSNSNFKVKECYKWIQDCGYIKFIDTAKDFDMSLLNDCFCDTEQGFYLSRKKILSSFNSISFGVEN